MTPKKSDESTNYTEAVGTRLSPQTMEQFEDYKDKHGIGNAEALRRLTRSGLKAESREREISVYSSGFVVAGMVGVILGLAGELDVFLFAFSAALVVTGYTLDRYGVELLNR